MYYIKGRSSAISGIGWDWMGLDGIGWDWMGLDGMVIIGRNKPLCLKRLGHQGFQNISYERSLSQWLCLCICKNNMSHIVFAKTRTQAQPLHWLKDRSYDILWHKPPRSKVKHCISKASQVRQGPRLTLKKSLPSATSISKWVGEPD